MTRRQRQIWNLVRDHWATHGCAPSYAYLSKVMGYSNIKTGGPYFLVKRLVERGHMVDGCWGPIPVFKT